ncbi:MAG: phenylalanine--tRNA ligase subunit beta [Rhodocyclaceae bacterium]
MQFPENWLRSLVDPPLTSAELASLLTMAGLEVESMEPVAPPFSGVVVGRVLAADPHPNADKLRVCRVDVGEALPLQIVCGAPNVAPGMRVPCARRGAELPGMKIEAARLRGVESNGMLCSARELGLGADQSGLLALPDDAPAGADVRAVLDLDDKIITLKLTPNRSDCLCVAGIAREVAALTGTPFRWPRALPVQPATDARREVALAAPAACPRYLGRVIRGIDAAAPAPEWMKRRLERCGVRSISAVVDVTNYVMLELGQPLHAFDNALLCGTIRARYARPGERLLLLNEQAIALAPDMLVIADDERPLALAGIMGGKDSGIGASTSELFLESAFFAPEAVAGKARALGFASDASYRFERGVDFEGTRNAIERASELILSICGGAAGPVSEARAELPRRDPVRLRAERVERVLGMALSADTIAELLASLGFAYERSGGSFRVTPPSYRFDVSIEEDLIEELARLHGYDNVPVRAPVAPMAMREAAEGRRSPASLKRVLTGRDYQEVINFSFVDADWERDFCANEDALRLANPIAAQMAVMRSSLIGGLLANLSGNLKRKVARVRIFEIGRCFHRDPDGDLVAGFRQPLRIGGLCSGPAVPQQWACPTRTVDFFDVKADVEALLAPAVARFEAAKHPALHPGRSAAVTLGGRSIGFLGEIHPRWLQRYELGAGAVVFELDLEPLLERRVPAFDAPSRFPAVLRDLALVVARGLPADEVLDALRDAAPAIVRDIRLFDLYQGSGLDSGEKSLAFRIVMQDTERTLEDSEADATVASLVQVAQGRFAARLRG